LLGHWKVLRYERRAGRPWGQAVSKSKGAASAREGDHATGSDQLRENAKPAAASGRLQNETALYGIEGLALLI
jgi:hypothetical protein